MASGTGPAALRYVDLRQMPDDRLRHELIAGRHFMTPSPNVYHQRIVRNLVLLLDKFAQRHGGEVLAAPVDVLLSDENVVVPDVVYISERNLGIVTARCIAGAPDLVVEVLSPGTEKNDRTLKLRLYEGYGVRECWLVDPGLKQVTVYARAGEKFAAQAFSLDSGHTFAASRAFPDFQPDLGTIFRKRPLKTI